MLAVFVEVVDADVIFLADAEMVTIGVADLADAGIPFPADPVGMVTVAVADLADAGMPFSANPAGAVTVGAAFLANAEMVTIGVTDLADAGIPFPVDPAGTVTVGLAGAGIPFPADPSGAVTIGVASLADAGIVTVGVTDMADAGVEPLADAMMAFPADLAGVVTVGVTPLAETGMVTVGMADGADAAPVDGEGVDIRCGDQLSTGVWCRGRTPIRNYLHDQFCWLSYLVYVNYTMPTDDPKELFGNFLFGQMCPVINERTNWERCEALGETVMTIMGTLTVDPDPPITMTQGITESGVIGVMWKMTMDIMTPSRQVWRKKLSLSGVLWGWSRMLQWWLQSCAQRVMWIYGSPNPEPGEGSHLPILCDIGDADFKGPSLVVGDVSDSPVSVGGIISGPTRAGARGYIEIAGLFSEH